jgi:hypothetical protein
MKRYEMKCTFVEIDGENIADNDGQLDFTCEIESNTPVMAVMEALIDLENVIGFGE